MRTTRLITAALAAGAILAPATASAARLHAATGPCRLSETAEQHVLTSGESAQVYGFLTCGGAGQTGQSVTVYERSAGTGWAALGTTTTVAGGFYQLTASKLETDTSFYAQAAGIRSGTKIVRVAPIVTVEGPSETSGAHPESVVLYTGQRNIVTFIGTVSPADRGAQITLQREAASGYEEWHAIQNGVVGFGGTYAVRHRFVVPGDANLRMLVHKHGKFTIRGVSNTLSYEIVQAENPNLTLTTATGENPIKNGGAVTLEGKVAGASSAPVTLLSHAERSPAWSIVATGKSDSTGAYTFTQTPTINTYYKVQSSGKSSSVLFEGVKYVLTAGVSATTVQAGQPLTFSGTVAPVRSGKTVYLERQNAVGTGFHAIDVGSVGPAGTYSIADAVFGTGTDVFRIKVPGDPSNQAIASSLFTVTVTPAPPGPPASITPVLPHEGQL
jgi:hypothetical protein